MRIVPDACIAMRDPAAFLDGGGLDEHRAGAALRELSEVYEVPVGDVAILRRVLAHRRDDDAVAQSNIAQLDRLKQERACHRFLEEEDALAGGLGVEALVGLVGLL